MKARYGSREGWDTLIPRGPYSWGPWRGIMTQLEPFKAGLTFEVGDGRHVRFWSDVWCGESPLREVYPDIYAMAADQNVVVAFYLSVVGEETVWLPTLRRATFDWEIPRVTQLLNKLRGTRLNLGHEDHCVWVNVNSSLFSVKSCYEMLANVRMEEGPWKALWYTAVLLKVQFFLWTAAWTSFLQWICCREKVFVCLAYACYATNTQESCSHLLLHCVFSWEIWCGMVREFRLTFVAPSNIMNLIHGWRINALNSMGRTIWRLVPAAICWAVWRERNNRVFQG